MGFLFASVYLLVNLCANFPCLTLNFELSEELYEKCPYTDICNRTATQTLNITGMVPCCSSCKCDDKCGLRLDCCFDHLDRYQLKKKGVIACISRIVKRETRQTFKEAYWMVKACMKMKEGVHNNTYVPCDLYNKKGQLIVQPVSSKRTGDIYINAKCAECNDVHNFTRWNYSFIGSLPVTASLVWTIENSLKNRLGEIAYSAPKEEDWSMKRCFSIIQDTCPLNSTFERLCQTLQATYTTYKSMFTVRYKNIYCAMCTTQIKLRTQCVDEKKKSPFEQFTVLIDNSVTEPTKLLSTMMSNTGFRRGCLKENAIPSRSDPCLTIYCPEGMLRTQTGCEYFIRHLDITSFYIQLKLRPIDGNELPVAFVNALTDEERNDPSLWMQLPCYNVNATFTEVFYEKGKDGLEKVKSFIVRLWKMTRAGINPSIVLPMLRKCLKRYWYIKMGGDTYPFHATLDKQINYIQDGKQRLENVYSGVKENVPKPKLYDSITYQNSRSKRGAVAILRTYFCNQVRLPLHSVEVLPGELRILSRNITLGNNEFAINFYLISRGMFDFNKTTFSVCVEDFDNLYYQTSSMSAVFVSELQLERFVLYYAIICLII